MKKKINLLKRVAVAFTLALAIGTSSIPALPVNAEVVGVHGTTTEEEQKKTTPYMKTLKKVKFDLKKNKKVTYPNLWFDLGLKKQSAKITKYKVANAKKEGYKQVSFTVTYTDDYKPKNKAEVNTLGSAYEKYGDFFGAWCYAVVDYNTGKCLEGKNDYGVTVKCSKPKYYGYKKYTGTNGAWVRYPNKSKIKITITYPKDYKGLCFGVGGYLKTKESPKDKAFWKGKIPFGKAIRYYSAKKTNFHFMRIK